MKRLRRLPKSMMEVAKLEIAAWTRNKQMPEGMVMIILFAFIHRYTTGKTVEESFFNRPNFEPDYEI